MWKVFFGNDGCMNDDGYTFLPGGLRVRKSDDLICAMGSLDELSAALGLLRAQTVKKGDADLIRSIQGDLLKIGHELATEKPHLDSQRMKDLERETEGRKGSLAPLNDFVLPGDTIQSGFSHWARTSCRRAERELVRVQEAYPLRVTAPALCYLNRLSGLLFEMGREGL